MRPLTPVGPVRRSHLHAVNWLEDVLYGLLGEVVGAGHTYAVPGVVR